MATHASQPETPAPGDSYVQSFARGLQVSRVTTRDTGPRR